MGPINSHYDGQLQLLQREGEPSKVSPTIPRPLYSSFCTQQHIDCSAVTKRMGERATATPSIIIAISTGSKVQAAAARAIMPRGNVVNVTISLSRRKKHSARFTDIQFGSPTELGYRPDPNCVCDLRAPPIASTQHYQSFSNINLKMIRHSNFFYNLGLVEIATAAHYASIEFHRLLLLPSAWYRNTNKKSVDPLFLFSRRRSAFSFPL